MTTAQKVLLGLGVGAAAAAVTALVLRRRSSSALAGATPDRIGALQDAVWGAVRNPQMRELALAITGDGQRTVTTHGRRLVVDGAGCPARDGRCEADAVGRWVHQHQAIAADLFPGGDSSAGLACALLSLNGITCRFRMLQDSGKIYSMAGLPKNRPSTWNGVDVAVSQYRLGREPHGTAWEDYDG